MGCRRRRGRCFRLGRGRWPRVDAIIGTALLGLGPMLPPAFAHVDYVTDSEDSADPIGFVLDALGQPGSLLLLAVGAVVVLALLLAWARWRPLEEARDRLIAATDTYHEYLPWIVRLSVGLVLIGSGLSRVLFLPTLRSEEHTSELQSRLHLVCRLLLEKKKKNIKHYVSY